MAIGDVFTVKMGPGVTTRQPSSGVAEQICSTIKGPVTDNLYIDDATNAEPIFASAVSTGVVHGNSAATRQDPYNMAILIDNTNFVQKGGTTDRFWINGVQVDA